MTDREVQRVREVYAGYGQTVRRWDPANRGNRAISRERQRTVRHLLAAAGRPQLGSPVLDVGCGAGGTLVDLLGLGIPPSRLSGVDLLDERVAAAKDRLPRMGVVQGDARDLPYPSGSFGLVTAFTLLSSITDPSVALEVAAEIDRVLAPAGAVLVYDIAVRNPCNPNIRPLAGRIVAEWFPGFASKHQRLTLLPPLARHLWSATSFLYPLLGHLPQLRTHSIWLLQRTPTDT